MTPRCLHACLVSWASYSWHILWKTDSWTYITYICITAGRGCRTCGRCRTSTRPSMETLWRPCSKTLESGGCCYETMFKYKYKYKYKYRYMYVIDVEIHVVNMHECVEDSLTDWPTDWSDLHEWINEWFTHFFTIPAGTLFIHVCITVQLHSSTYKSCTMTIH